MKIKLKNCPCCGDIPKIGRIVKKDGRSVLTISSECGLQLYGSYRFDDDDSEAEIIKSWNKRTKRVRVKMVAVLEQYESSEQSWVN